MTLGEVLERIDGGGTPSRAIPQYWGGDIPWAGVKDLKSSRLVATEENITPAGLENSATRLIPEGTVLIATRMAVGRVVWTEVDTTINQDLKALIAGPQLDPRFLFQFMGLHGPRLEASGAGTTVEGIRLGTLRSLAVLLPPLRQQQRIAAILDAVDAAIDHSEAVVTARESLRRAVLATMLVRGVPGRHNAWKEAPGIGLMPASWEVSTLGGILREPIRNGVSMVAPEHSTGHWQFTLSAVTFSGLDSAAIKPAPRVSESAGRLASGDLLVSRSNTRDRVGLAGIYRGIPDDCSYPDLLMRMRVDERIALTEFVEAALLSPRGREYFQRQARGTSGSMVKITGKIAGAFPVLLPPIAEQREIVHAINQGTSALHAATEHVASLRLLKAAVGRALLTGRVRTTN